MPNWVYNVVTFDGSEEDIKHLKKNTSGETCFDFNKIITQPQELDLESGSTERLAIKCAKLRREGISEVQLTDSDLIPFEYVNTKELAFKELADLGDKYLSNIDKYGHSTWYDWRIDNWGTKWNACDPSWTDEKTLEFNTAWNMPQGIYRKLSQMYPNICIEVRYADEDLGSNCGTATFQNGKVDINQVNDFKFASDLWGVDIDIEY